MKPRSILYLAIGVIFISNSCTRNDVVKPAVYNYFPLSTGRFYLYNVDSIRYAEVPISIQKPDTFHFQLLDSVTASFSDGTGRQAFRIDEYRKDNGAVDWQYQKSFTRNSNTDQAEETDGNMRYVKLVFPAYLHLSWNANQYNIVDSLKLLQSEYTEVNKPSALSGNNYNHTVLVQLQNDTNLINDFTSYERYADGIGLIYRQQDSVYTNEISIDDPNKYFTGYRRMQILSTYGPK